MKKRVWMILVVALVLSSCSSKVFPLGFEADEVGKIAVSRSTGSDDPNIIDSREEIAEIVDYINNMGLTRNGNEDPSQYDGMGFIIVFYCKDGSSVRVCFSGNMFLRIGDQPWMSVKFDEAEALSQILWY